MVERGSAATPTPEKSDLILPATAAEIQTVESELILSRAARDMRLIWRTLMTHLHALVVMRYIYLYR